MSQPPPPELTSPRLDTEGSSADGHIPTVMHGTPSREEVKVADGDPAGPVGNGAAESPPRGTQHAPAPRVQSQRHLRPVSPPVVSPSLQQHAASGFGSERSKVPSPKRERTLAFTPGTGGYCPGFGIPEEPESKQEKSFAPREFIAYPYMPASRFYRPSSAPTALKAPAVPSQRLHPPSAMGDWREFDTPAEYEAALRRIMTHDIPSRPQPSLAERQFKVNFMPKVDRRAFALREICRQYATLQEVQAELLRDVVLTPDEVAAYHAIPQCLPPDPSPSPPPTTEPVFRSGIVRKGPAGSGQHIPAAAAPTPIPGVFSRSPPKALRQSPPPAVGIQLKSVQPRLDAIIADLVGHDAPLRGCANTQLPKKVEASPTATTKGSRTLPFPSGFGGRPSSIVGPKPGAMAQERWSPYRNR
eukprot:GGOE01014341.1.p1 GENE.GGOE01014341.1~~GGOE01014341.1.p1  ORF type:complete len:433 (+),score=88.55 GGOE01014341.1:57-1301(+)